MNNRKINIAKKVKSEAGNAMIKYVKSAMETGNTGVHTVEEQARVQEILADVQNKKFRTNGEDDGKSASRRSTASTISKKSTRPKLARKSKRAPRKRKSFDDDDEDDDDDIDYSEPASARTPVESSPWNTEMENSSPVLAQHPNDMTDAISYGHTRQESQEAPPTLLSQRHYNENVDRAMEDADSIRESFAGPDDENDGPQTPYHPQHTANAYEREDAYWHRHSDSQFTIDPSLLRIDPEDAAAAFASRTIYPWDVVEEMNGHYYS